VAISCKVRWHCRPEIESFLRIKSIESEILKASKRCHMAELENVKAHAETLIVVIYNYLALRGMLAAFNRIISDIKRYAK
jgi:hypothetical protein